MNEKNKNTQDTERRKYVRLESKSIVKCEIYRITDDENIPEATQSTSKNISAGGILFETTTPFAIGELLRLEVNLAGWQKFKPEFYKADQVSGIEPLVALAHVVRVEVIGKGIYDVGVCLAGIDEGHQMAIRKFIDEKLREVARGE